MAAVNPNHRLSSKSSSSSQEGGANAHPEPQQENVHQLQDNIVFPMKLHRLLDEMEVTGQTSIISWLKHGAGFKIKDRQKFAHDVLPKFFGTNKLKSFQRNLNLWGFASGKKVDERGIYSCSNFLRGHKELCLAMKRSKRISTASNERKQKCSPGLPSVPRAREERSTGSSSSSAGSINSKGEEEEKEDTDDELEEKEEDTNDDDMKRKPFPNCSESLIENIRRNYVSSDAIILELRRRQQCRQEEGARNHAEHILRSAASSAAVLSPPPNIFSSLLQRVGTAGLLSLSPSTPLGDDNSCSFPWLGTTAAAPATQAPAIQAPAPFASFSDTSIPVNNNSSLMEAYLSSQQEQQIQLRDESACLQNVAAILLQHRQQQQQEQAAVAARNDQLIANAVRDFAAADDDQKRNITALLLMLLESKN